MTFDPFAAAEAAKARGVGSGRSGGSFEPGYVLTAIGRIDTTDAKDRINYSVRFGKDSKRFIPGANVWGMFQRNYREEPSQEKESAEFLRNIKGFFTSVVVKTGDEEYQTLMNFAKESGEANGASDLHGWANLVSAVGNAQAEKGNLFALMINQARNPRVTANHAKAAKAMLKSYEMDGYYNGITGMVLFEEWASKEGQVPDHKPLPAKFGMVDRHVSGAADEDTGSSMGEPPADEASIPF